MENSLFILIAGGWVGRFMSLLYGWKPQDLFSTDIPELLPGRNTFSHLTLQSSCHSVTP